MFIIALTGSRNWDTYTTGGAGDGNIEKFGGFVQFPTNSYETGRWQHAFSHNKATTQFESFFKESLRQF